MKSLPYFCRGEVVRGFGRGSKELGIPTANFPDGVVEHLPADISTGIYYGWACVGSGDVHKMVMSIGWNPYYNNTKKSMRTLKLRHRNCRVLGLLGLEPFSPSCSEGGEEETHVIHTFKEDFYGEVLSVVLVGYIRPEKSFDSLEALISAINGDIEEAKAKLDKPEHLKLKTDNFFSSSATLCPNGATTASNGLINGH